MQRKYPLAAVASATRFALVAFPLASAGGGALAQTYTVQAGIQQSFEYDSNPLLSSRSPQEVGGSITAPQATLTAETETAKAELFGKVVANRFTDNDFDSNDVYLTAATSLRGQVTKVGLNAALDYDTTRTSELTGSGSTVAGVRHLRYGVTPDVEVKLSPVDTVSTTLSYGRTVYDSARFTDYEDWAITPAWRRAFSPLDTGRVAIQASRFTSLDDQWNEVDSIGPMVGWERKLSERLRVGGAVGVRFSHARDYAGASTDSQGYLANFTVDYQGLQDTLRFSYDRNLAPLGNGTQVQADQAEAGWVHGFGPVTYGELRAQLVHQTSLDTDQDQQRTYYDVEPRIRFQLTESWDLSPTYRYRHQTGGLGGDEADSHTVLLTVGYKGGKLALD
ncbi:MAG TPA: hypothetical protein VK196_07520 [Magnetospirillum sp.]|nr:hypothetical protein [Magnetospirillum sp.]